MLPDVSSIVIFSVAFSICIRVGLTITGVKLSMLKALENTLVNNSLLGPRCLFCVLIELDGVVFLERLVVFGGTGGYNELPLYERVFLVLYDVLLLLLLNNGPRVFVLLLFTVLNTSLSPVSILSIVLLVCLKCWLAE